MKLSLSAKVLISVFVCLSLLVVSQDARMGIPTEIPRQATTVASPPPAPEASTPRSSGTPVLSITAEPAATAEPLAPPEAPAPVVSVQQMAQGVTSGANPKGGPAPIGAMQAGTILENFPNSWQGNTIGLVYNPSLAIVRYAHESQPNPTIYDIDYFSPHAVQGNIQLSTVNAGWPVALDNRDGVGYNPDTGHYFLPDYQGDLINADDNIIQIDASGVILNAWETDGASNDSYDASFITYIIDIAVVPGTPPRYFAAAANDGSVVYEIDLINTGAWWTPNSWGTLNTWSVPGLGDNVGIDYDAEHGVLYHSDDDSQRVVITDLDGNQLFSFICPSPNGRSTGVTYIENSNPPEVWVTDWLSNSTTRCQAPAWPYPDVVFFEDFESGYGNWTGTGLWNAESETDTCGASVAPFPSTSQAVYYGLDGVCTYDTGAVTQGNLTLNSTIDLRAVSPPIELSFASYEQTECGGNCSYDDRLVQVDDGSGWTTVWDSGSEGSWKVVTVDLSAYAGKQISLRFRFDSVDSMFNNYFGWMVDEVKVVAQPGGLFLEPEYEFSIDCRCTEQTHTLWVGNYTGVSDDIEFSYQIEGPLKILQAPTSIYLDTGQDVDFPIQVKLRSGIPLGTTGTLTITATVSSAPSFTETSVIEKQFTEDLWLEKADLPVAAMDQVVIEYNGLIYVVGGYGANGAVQIYDPVANSWRMGATEPSTVVGFPVDGCFGYDSEGHPVILLLPDADGPPTGVWHRYDIKDDEWDTPPLPAALPANGLWAPDIVSIPERNVCYISGGATIAGGGDQTTLYSYYPDSNTAFNLGNFTHIPAGFDFHASWFIPWIGDAGAICVAGGVDVSGVVYADTQCYDIAAATFNPANSDIPQLPEPWWGMADMEIFDGSDQQLWVLNGVDAAWALINATAYYSRTDGAWHYGPTPPVSVYRYESVSYLKRDLFLMGGSDGGLNYQAHNYRFLRCPSFFELDPRGWLPESNANTQSVYWHQGAVGTNPNAYGEVAYYCGGLGPPGDDQRSELQMFDPATGAWTQLATMPAGVFGAACGWIDGELYVAGGFAGAWNGTTDLQVYDPVTNTWDNTTPPNIPAASGRGGCAGGVATSSSGSGLSFYVVGGGPDDNGANATKETWEYNPATGNWTQRDDYPGTHIYDFTFGAACGCGGKLYVGGNYFGNREFFVLDPTQPSGSQWTQLADIPGGAGVLSPALVCKEEEPALYLIGGDYDGGGGDFSSAVYRYDIAADVWTGPLAQQLQQPDQDSDLWLQVNPGSTDYASQDFEAGWDNYDIYAADDFQNTEPWTIEYITTMGGWGAPVDLNNATQLHWYIYADAAGEPAGVPGDGQEFWTISLPPSDSQVSLGVSDPKDVVLTPSSPVNLPPGTWWLIFYPSLNYSSYGQYGLRESLDPVWGTPGMQNNPGGAFGLPLPGWNINMNNMDFVFQLEQTLLSPGVFGSVGLHLDGKLWTFGGVSHYLVPDLPPHESLKQVYCGEGCQIEFEKSGPNEAYPGDIVSFTISIRQLFGEALKGLVMEDLIPSGAVYAGNLSADRGQASYDAGMNMVTWVGETGPEPVAQVLAEPEMTPAAKGTLQQLYEKAPVVAAAATNATGKPASPPSAYRYLPAEHVAQAYEILIYADDPYHTAPNTYVDQALQYLGLTYTAHYNGDFSGFATSLTSGGPWDLVIFSNDQNAALSTTLDALETYVSGGGRLLLNSWRVGAFPAHGLWSALGLEYVSNDTEPPNPVLWWQAGHPLFSFPRNVPAPADLVGLRYGVYGQGGNALPGFLALAGYTDHGPQTDQTAIVLGNDDHTIFRGFMDGHNDADLDADGLPDNVELWINMVNHVLLEERASATISFDVQVTAPPASEVYNVASLQIPCSPEPLMAGWDVNIEATPTPTPTPTPVELERYSFEPCPDGWTFRALPPADVHISWWDDASSLCTASAIGIATPYDESTNYFALWDSYDTTWIPYTADSLYGASWQFSTNRGTTNAVPSVRFRIGLTNQKAFAYSRAYPGDWVPLAQTPGATSYTLYFEPPIEASGLFLAFSLIDWAPDFRGSMPAGEVYLEEAVVVRQDLAHFTNWSLVDSFSDFDSWTTAGAPPYTYPTYTRSVDGISMESGIGSDRVFGTWDSPISLFTLDPNTFYRLTLELSSNPQLGGPDLRLRINTDDYRYAWYTYYVTSYTPGESALPSESGEDYHLYLTLPGSSSQSCRFSLDLIDFADYIGGTLSLHQLSLDSMP